MRHNKDLSTKKCSKYAYGLLLPFAFSKKVMTNV